MSLIFDKYIIEALKKAGEAMMHEAREQSSYSYHTQKLLTMFGSSIRCSDLNTVQKIKIFRFVYNVENASIID